MKVVLASVDRQSPDGRMGELAAVYCRRLDRYLPTQMLVFRSQPAFLQWLSAVKQRRPPTVVILDPVGEMLSSESFAAWIGKQRDGGCQTLVFAVGPVDGWSETSRARAGMLLSLGRMTLPHELARLVLAEQVYRAFTILAGHPYHGGH